MPRTLRQKVKRPPVPAGLPRCPKCAGRLVLDRDVGALLLPPEPVCLMCGWRRVVTLAEVRITAPAPRLPVEPGKAPLPSWLARSAATAASTKRRRPASRRD